MIFTFDWMLGRQTGGYWVPRLIKSAMKAEEERDA